MLPLRALLLFSFGVHAVGGCACSDVQGSHGLTLAVQASAGCAVLANGFVCASLEAGVVRELRGDYQGLGIYGANLVADEGMTLQTEDAAGSVCTSANSPAAEFTVLQNTSMSASLKVSDITVCGTAPTVSERWTFSLAAESRVISFVASGKVLGSSIALRAVRRHWPLSPSSVYAFFVGGGVVQMKAGPGGADFYPTASPLSRVYALGGPMDTAAGNASIDFLFAPTGSTDEQTVLLSSQSGDPYWSGLQQVLAGGVRSSQLDGWMGGWAGVPATSIAAGTTWFTAVNISVNNLDFPTGKVGAGSQQNLELVDMQTVMLGPYGSAAGALCTHKNQVAPGITVGQVATTIARPNRGYHDTYNYFDPDNYFTMTSLLWTNDPFLQEEVRSVIERSGSFIKDTGQLPHHFKKAVPTYQALSGEIQTGPNVFWILTAFNYAKATQDFDWLEKYMPKLRLASGFLFSLIDPTWGLARVPGSLMIDVFIRSNFTSDTNAMLVGFFREFAAAEALLGNHSGHDALMALSGGIAAAMNELLWDEDHYITQWDGPPTNKTRDFVDYDSNFIALAHGVPSAEMAAKLFSRIDGGKCRASSTWVSEVYYGPNDTAHGNVGDSATAMARIAWFEAQGRRVYGDGEGFFKYVLNPLQRDVMATTWMHERLNCDGTENLKRTSYYFEYPSAISMMVRRIKLGIELGYRSILVNPIASGPSSFSYHVNELDIEYSQSQCSLSVPPLQEMVAMKFILKGLKPSALYRVSGAPRACSTPSSPDITSSDDGTLSFSAMGGRACTVSVQLMSGVLKT